MPPFKLRLAESVRHKLSRRSSTASQSCEPDVATPPTPAPTKLSAGLAPPTPSSPHHPRSRTAGLVLDGRRISPSPHRSHRREGSTSSVANKATQLSLPILAQTEAETRSDGPVQLRQPSAETIASRSESLASNHHQPLPLAQQDVNVVNRTTTAPIVALEEPTPTASDQLAAADPGADDSNTLETADDALPLPTPGALLPRSRPQAVRRQSLVHNSNARLIKTLLDPAQPTRQDDYFVKDPAATLGANMIHRKIWVRRPGASATLVQVREDDLVDDVRDVILGKYKNSLGKSFDAPDVTLRIVPRDAAAKHNERTLGPEEEMCRTLDAYFPGGQTVDEALIIDVPQRRTPKPSPRHGYPPHASHYYDEHHRPVENGTDYFPPMPVNLGVPSPGSLTSLSHESRQSHAAQERDRSIAVLTTGQVPPLPSPGTRRSHTHRPKYHRHPTSSPTQLVHPGAPAASSQQLPPRPGGRPRHDSTASETKHAVPNPPPLPTPPAPEVAPTKIATPPAPRVQSPDPRKPKKSKRQKADNVDMPSLPSGLLDGSVPPINVLIVEDNIINLKLLEAFMKRLKVRWQTAMNGRDAVTKWRAGGFHLVLMDIQLPIMSGLEATKEIRRLERVNNIGVFSNPLSMGDRKKSDDSADGDSSGVTENDKLLPGVVFKSPVIIVALTASSLQSDRHEALAAGCNDFLTKPVNFVWLERKVKEWGCMQALIDYDGWRKWKTFTDDQPPTDTAKAKLKKKANRASISTARLSTGTPSPANISSPSPEHQALAQAGQVPPTSLLDGTTAEDVNMENPVEDGVVAT
ncbi:hypothetical protein IWX90DRAFT_46354 [Phyllosticta citrichinensis]|uniref:Response regulatory domain-containing protein n=1 Tax=Phyllosticta citrichinensis TaxID=1130410 RepID=A0ABR1XHX1_9PEZI